jgi:tetratricopeptide (TPR) repeat protein
MHLFFLGACLWIFFDPRFSPRELGFQITSYLTFYYLAAICVGYFIGYVLLVFGRKPVQQWARPTGFAKMVEPIVLVVSCIAVVIAPFALARKNFPVIRADNSDVLHEFSKATAAALSEKNAIVLSDDVTRLYLVQAINAQSGKPAENILLDTASLPMPGYQKWLHGKYSKDWPQPASTNRIDDIDLLQHLVSLSQTHPIYYLHPSFGYYYESFYLTPRNLVYELHLYPTNTIQAPPLSATVIAENQAFWSAFIKDRAPQLPALAKLSDEAHAVNAYYSRSLNYWGTELQKAKKLDDAATAFATAISLNPENAVAKVNQLFNAGLRKGEIRPVQPDEELQKSLEQYRDWATALTWNGPFDEPNFDTQLGEELARGRNLRQSAQLFTRALELNPNNVAAQLDLAKTDIELQRPDNALKLVREIRENPKSLTQNTNLNLELLRVESLAQLSKNDLPAAEKVLKDAVAQQPKDERRIGLLTEFYITVRQYTNALEMVEKQLKASPKNPQALFAKAVLQMQLAQYPAAIQTLDQVLKLQPDNNNALLNRAIANLQSGKLDDAKRDYETLRDVLPNDTYQIDYGLAKIAEKQNNKKAELENYKLYLKNAPTGTKEYNEVQKRVSALEK